MCGILGGFAATPLERRRVNAAFELIEHRGPDAASVVYHQNDRVLLAHRRLKVVDLDDRANQPMRSACGRYEIIYNGEIYDFDRLRSLVPDYPFKTSGDTEVILALYAAYGADMLPRLNGMFAFAIYDHERGELFLARDRFGIKPLYFSARPDAVLFCSEIPPLLKLTGRAEPDLNSIKSYLATGVYDFGVHTFFDGITRLEAGCCATLKLSDLKLESRRWYQVTDFATQSESLGDDEIGERLDDIFANAVRRHLMADVAVGVNISGGLDSSALLHYVNRYHQHIQGFTQDYVPPYSERPWVEQAARDTGAVSNFIMIEAEQALDAFTRAMRYQAEPYGGIPVIGFDFLYQRAEEKGITVLLDGNGVDEVLLGYKKYHLAYLAESRGQGAYADRLADFSAFWDEEPKQVESAVARMSNNAGAAIDGTISVHADALGSALTHAEIRHPELPESTGDRVRDLAIADMVASKIPRALRFNDRVSMMHSKELRVPFLDPELVEFSLALPTERLLNREARSDWTSAAAALIRGRAPL
ncbi:MAG: asparagine synthase (glutamine-hydrolyzing), partial [Gammaproteobacteria bacterium]